MEGSQKQTMHMCKLLVSKVSYIKSWLCRFENEERANEKKHSGSGTCWNARDVRSKLRKDIYRPKPMGTSPSPNICPELGPVHA